MPLRSLKVLCSECTHGPEEAHDTRSEAGKITSGVSRVYVASRRLPMMHRDGWDGPRANSAMSFAWFVCDARHHGPTQLGFFDWKQFEAGRIERPAAYHRARGE